MHGFIVAVGLVVCGILINTAGPAVAGEKAPGQPSTPAKTGGKLHLSAPYTHDNLTLFFVHGPETMPGRKMLTLAEALEQKKVVVVETSDVNQLTVENKGDVDVFIMTGDIVKGGKQDRVMGYDLLLSIKSGPMPILSFCVEHGRWQQRGSESAEMFSSSMNTTVGNSLKQAISGSRSQGEVWDKVAESQKKLSGNVGASVTNGASATSLQLSLENKDLQNKVVDYEKDLAGGLDKEKGAIGMVIAVNGKLSAADVYGSQDLFRKVWTRQLRSAATEALAEWKKDQKFEPVAATAAESFLASAVDADKKEEKLSTVSNRGNLAGTANGNPTPNQSAAPNRALDKASDAKPPAMPVRLYRYEKKDSLVIECQDAQAPDQILHRTYLAK